MKDLLVVTESLGSENASLDRPAWLRMVPWITSLGRCVQVRVFIPSVDRNRRRLSLRSVQASIERLLLGLAGGGNFTQGRGLWQSGSGDVSRERMGIGDAYVSVDVTQRALSNFLLSLRILASEWNQEAVLVVIGEWPLLISGSEVPATGDVATRPSVLSHASGRGGR
jgi:hypothetical protein